ncbi:rho GTPase-activating protein 44-like [Conger conger]|uniref:rho GTPase-activating protein 44-like n=1 Tax=Conger conger TaxID=82655 RepID=UPI002A5A9DD7|nr:rho GTPase-activating protein 44-like [Conger conger]
MKKQFNRMRQLANQTVGRAEKTEVLSDDLLQVEKRLELVKQVSHSTHKKLTTCLQGQQGVDVDKKSVRSPSKKLPLTTLAQCLVEGAAVLGDDSLLGKMLKLCGDSEDRLAQELILFELQIERDVIEPLYVLAEVEIPNIQKQRKHLAKLVLDMDSARTRWHQSSKSSGLSSNLQPSGAKADALREEMEEAANRMEICRDQLSADMYNFVAKEIDYANYFQMLIEVQAEYHRKSLEILQNILPQIKAHQEAWVEKPCYGKPLEEHLTISGRDIAFPIEACVTMLLECGLQEEGLFRVAPSASKLKKLKASLDCGVLDVQEYSADPHAIAGALKSYLRELPEPLMTFELYEEWIQASNIQDQDKRLQALLSACEKLPPANGNNFNSDEASSNWSDSCYVYPSPEEERPPPPYPASFCSSSSSSSSCYPPPYHLYPKAQPCPRPVAPGPESVPPGPSPPSFSGWAVHSPPLPPPFSPGQQLDINSNPKPSSLHLPHQGTHSEPPHALPSETNASPLYMKTPLVLTRHDPSLGAPPSQTPSAPQWVTSGCNRDRGPGLTSTLKNKELSPVIGQRAVPAVVPPANSSQANEHSPHTLRKANKKLAPTPPKVGQSGGVSDQSTGQPSPGSLSPTPPSTPSPYGFGCPQGYATIASPGTAPSLSSPPSLSGTLTKSRPTPKPRQRPTLPPPQPPGTPGLPPQPLEQALLDGLSGDSMSTDSLFDLEIPAITVELDGLPGGPLGHAERNSVSPAAFAGKAESEEESEVTAL